MTTLCVLMMLYPGFVYIHPEHVVHTSKTLHPIILRMEFVVLSEDTDVLEVCSCVDSQLQFTIWINLSPA